jgi:hypothetical protein
VGWKKKTPAREKEMKEKVGEEFMEETIFPEGLNLYMHHKFMTR